MLLLVVISCAAASGLGWMIASKYPERRSPAILLTVLLGLMVAEIALDATVLGPLRARLGVHVPWTGWAWVAALVYNALELAWPATVVGSALVVFSGNKPWAAIAAWAAAVASYAVLHPIAGDGGQARFLATADLLGAITAAGMGIAWYRQRTASDSATSTHHVLATIILMELLALPEIPRVGALQSWPTPPVVYMVVLAVVALMQIFAVLERVAAVERRQDVADKSNLRAHVIAAAAVRTAEDAKEMATEARSLADNIPAAPPPSRRPPSTATPEHAGEKASEPPGLTNGAPPSSRRGSSTPTASS
jgi:hypothetical protein